MQTSKNIIDYILSEYKNGKSQKTIADSLGTYNTTIRRILLRNGITDFRTSGFDKNVVKSNPFLNKESDYWIGMLATDGCLTRNNTRVVLELKEEDLEVMQQYKEFIQYPVNINTTNHYSGNKLYRVSFTNREACLFLNNLGITPRKSYNLELNCTLNKDIFRGILDGDGCITAAHTDKCAMNICSASAIFINQVKSYLESLGFHPTLTISKNGRKTPLYYLNMYKQKELSELYDIIYKDAKYFMKRKYLKFGSLLGKPSK